LDDGLAIFRVRYGNWDAGAILADDVGAFLTILSLMILTYKDDMVAEKKVKK